LISQTQPRPISHSPVSQSTHSDPVHNHQPEASPRQLCEGLPITPHEARHCTISYFIAAGLDWKQISTWAGHGDVHQSWNRYRHLVPGGEDQARERLDAFLNPPTVAHPVAQDATKGQDLSADKEFWQYRYRDSNLTNELCR
jgi:hypothetical protein